MTRHTLVTDVTSLFPVLGIQTLPSEHTHPEVFVVDDEPALVEVICAVLEDEGMTALGCEHGAEAYERIRRVKPKLVILDVQMPMVDGIQVFWLLRADPLTAEIPVIFLTANVHVLYARLPTFSAMGANVLSKPFNIITLISQVQQILKSLS